MSATAMPQPVLRYDLGDSVMERPDCCPCGSPFPAIKVQGRSADVGTHGGKRAISPLAFSLSLDGIPGIEMFQIVQSDPTRLRVRLASEPGADSNRIWQSHRKGTRRAAVKARHREREHRTGRGAAGKGAGRQIPPTYSIQLQMKPTCRRLTPFASVNVAAALIPLPHRHGDANMKAAWLFTRSDAIRNSCGGDRCQPRRVDADPVAGYGRCRHHRGSIPAIVLRDYP